MMILARVQSGATFDWKPKSPDLGNMMGWPKSTNLVQNIDKALCLVLCCYESKIEPQRKEVYHSPLIV